MEKVGGLLKIRYWLRSVYSNIPIGLGARPLDHERVLAPFLENGMDRKKIFSLLKGGDWFKYRSALYLKIGVLSVYKLSGKPGKFNVRLFTTTDRSVYFYGDVTRNSLVTPVKVDINA